MKNKVIIHQKYDVDKILPRELSELHNMLVETLPKDYIVISTPTDVQKLDGDDIVIYTYNELVDVIEKAWAYDELKF